MESFHLCTVDFSLMPFFRRQDGVGIGLAEELPEEALFRAHERGLFKLAGMEPVRAFRRVAIYPAAVVELVLLNDAEELFDGRQLPCASHPAIDAQGKLPVVGHGPGRGLRPCGPQFLELVLRWAVQYVGCLWRTSSRQRGKIPPPLYPLGSWS